jgi:pimeloyl-ACP methyl ester carboxylesterase
MPYVDLTAYAENSNELTILGHKIRYWQAGTGEPLLLIHGFPSASWDWHTIWPELTQKYTVTAIDMLGFGLSDKPHPHQYSVIEQADIVSAVLVSLNINQTHVLSHDYGDSVGQELLCRALTHHANVQILSWCLLNGGIFPKFHRPLLTQTLLKSGCGPLLAKLIGKSSLKRSFKSIFGPQTPPKENEIESLWTLLNHHQGKRVLPSILKYIDERQLQGERWIAGMQKALIPICFINGVHDPISGAHMADRFAELLPDQQLHRLDCGHYPQLELPDQVLAHYFSFRNASINVI